MILGRKEGPPYGVPYHIDPFVAPPISEELPPEKPVFRPVIPPKNLIESIGTQMIPVPGAPASAKEADDSQFTEGLPSRLDEAKRKANMESFYDWASKQPPQTQGFQYQRPSTGEFKPVIPPGYKPPEYSMPMLPELEGLPLDNLGQESPARTPQPQPESQVASPSFWQKILGERGSQDEAVRKMRGWQDVAEGLGSMRFTSGAQIRAGMEPLPPFKATGIRTRIEEIQDELSPQERDFIQERFSMQLPEGYKRTQLSKVFPLIASFLAKQMYAEERSEGLALRKENMESLKEERAFRRSMREQAEGRIPEVAMRSITEKGNLLNSIQRLESDFQANPNAAGPIVGRVNQILNKIGIAGTPTTVQIAELASLLSNYARSISGAQIHVTEFDRLGQQLPAMGQIPDNFAALLQRFKQQAESEYDNALKFQHQNKRDIEGFKRPGANYDKIFSKGTLRIPASDTIAIEEATRDGYTVETY